MSVTVVVNKSASCSPSRIFVQQSGVLSDIGKSPIAIVAIQLVLAEVGAKQIFEAVVIVVSNANTCCPTCIAKAGSFGNIRERSITIIFIQAIGRFRRGAFDFRAAKQKNIDPAVIVVIDESATTAGRFEDVIFRIGTAVNDRRGQPSGDGYIDEMCVERFSGWSWFGLGFHRAWCHSLPQQVAG